MTHRSENATRLDVHGTVIQRIEDAVNAQTTEPDVHLFWIPPRSFDPVGQARAESLAKLIHRAAHLPNGSLVAFLTTPSEAARILESIPRGLRFQLWNAVKVRAKAVQQIPGQLPAQHAALLVLSRYDTTLKHTKTRLAYTFCPACGKTTKDYGGKKHTYNEYGTLLSDVWRDVEIDPVSDIEPVVDRLRDLFGLAPHRTLWVHDLRSCQELQASSPADMPKQAEPIAQIGKGSKARPTVQLLNGDCIETLRGLSDDSVDYVFVDPPYNVSKVYDSWNDGLEITEYFRWCDSWLDELCRVLKPGHSLTIINIPLWTARHFAHLSKTMQFQNWIAWDGLSLPVRMVMPAHYGMLSMSKGNPRPLPGIVSSAEPGTRDFDALRPAPEFYCVRQPCILKNARRRALAVPPVTDLWYDIHRLKHNSKRVDHPCQLPPGLMYRLFALFTAPGETVLDCFDGAGTTSLTAAQMRRSAIGIELSPEYHALAKSRHADLAAGVDPFGKRESQPPKAKNSRVDRLPKRKYIVAKKVLQLEVRQIAREIGRLPTREDVAAKSRHPIAYFDEYFVSWGEVCAAARHAGMSELPTDPILTRSAEQSSLF